VAYKRIISMKIIDVIRRYFDTHSEDSIILKIKIGKVPFFMRN